MPGPLPPGKSMAIVDANVILRYLLDDDVALASAAREIVESGALAVPTEVFCEVVFVLQKVYRVPRYEISLQLRRFAVRADSVLSRKRVILKALDFFAVSNLDFVDCILAGYAGEGERIHTFDKQLNRFIEELPQAMPFSGRG